MSDILKLDNIRKLEKLENVEDFNKRIREAKYPPNGIQSNNI